MHMPLDMSLKRHYTGNPYSRGDSGALYLQPALAEVISCLGCPSVRLPRISDADVRVLTQQNPVNLVRTGM